MEEKAERIEKINAVIAQLTCCKTAIGRSTLSGVEEYEGAACMAWHKIHLTLDQNLIGLEAKIRDAFDGIWLAARNDPEMVLFSVCYSPSRDIDVFVSPKFSSVATPLLSRYQAASCPPPARHTENLALLLGLPDAWTLLP